MWAVNSTIEVDGEGFLRFDPDGPDRDCGDFDTHAEAQAFFEAAGGPTTDRHRLDGDRDGVVCESLP
ncbi:MAG: excalibur calcium-binding domain-containing protein [Chloroflexi bacterium]|nr:excalibur calcium-binding domain-containing protein [Chloroflexota bacterium]